RTRGRAMSPTQIEVTGTLQADGTLVLDQTPNLPAGRVRVTVQVVEPAPPPAETLLEFVQRSRRELEAAGSPFMNEQELNAHVEWLRQGDSIDELLGQAEEERRRRERPGC